jgi:hypothetical protein
MDSDLGGKRDLKAWGLGLCNLKVILGHRHIAHCGTSNLIGSGNQPREFEISKFTGGNRSALLRQQGAGQRAHGACNRNAVLVNNLSAQDLRVGKSPSGSGP